MTVNRPRCGFESVRVEISVRQIFFICDNPCILKNVDTHHHSFVAYPRCYPSCGPKLLVLGTVSDVFLILCCSCCVRVSANRARYCSLYFAFRPLFAPHLPLQVSSLRSLPVKPVSCCTVSHLVPVTPFLALPKLSRLTRTPKRLKNSFKKGFSACSYAIS